MIRAQLVIATFLGLGNSAIANESDTKEKSKYHCEKSVDGKTKDLPDVKNRKDCKKAGGNWKKAHKEGGNGHQHGEGDDHNHK
ncbi:MAG: hypothetical protein R3B45_07630 [Bdellovibrionota bacterium]